MAHDYLVQHFKFDDTRVKIIGLGKFPKGTEAGKIEILIYDWRFRRNLGEIQRVPHFPHDSYLCSCNRQPTYPINLTVPLSLRGGRNDSDHWSKRKRRS